VVGIVTGEVLSSSWWSHPQAKEIFALLEELSQRPDVLETELLERNVTFQSGARAGRTLARRAPARGAVAFVARGASAWPSPESPREGCGVPFGSGAEADRGKNRSFHRGTYVRASLGVSTS
jgi:hypothetical protein